MTAISLVKMLDRFTAPLTGLGVILGGVIWLTTLHGIAEQNQKDIQSLTEIHKQKEILIMQRLHGLEGRLARIEGKIDMMIENKRNASRLGISALENR